MCIRDRVKMIQRHTPSDLESFEMPGEAESFEMPSEEDLWEYMPQETEEG